MKALTLRPVWPWAMFDLREIDPAVAKATENRTWRPPYWAVGGEIAIHSGKTYDVGSPSQIWQISGHTPPDRYPAGAIVGTAKLVGFVVQNDYGPNTIEGQAPAGYDPDNDRWFFGPYGWLFDDFVKLRFPVPARGKLGLWRVPLREFSQIVINKER